jgi:tetratricopeptide (TPR) repeat protein
MPGTMELRTGGPPTTDGEIAVVNLESTRRRCWSRFWEDPRRDGIAEAIIEQEQLTAQFIGDLAALDRLGALANHLALADAESARTSLLRSQVASTTHRFADARRHLDDATLRGAPINLIDRLSLAIDQACGTQLEAVLDKRQAIAAASPRLEDQVPLGALLADLGRFQEADKVYRRALDEYRDVSPFAVAWVCFQLGVLWGEFVREPDTARAVYWYTRALHHLPQYAKARVHLAEIYLSCDRPAEAEELLIPALAASDPEVHWRLASAMTAQGKSVEAEGQIQAAETGFEELLAQHPLAFADHAAVFFADRGDLDRALEFACINVSNRPTLRAFEQAHAIALRCDAVAATRLRCEALQRWGDDAALRLTVSGESPASA